MNEYRQDNTLSIVALVLGGLGFLLSLIPCIGFFSIPLGVIGLIIGAIAYFKANDNGDKKTMSIVALVVSFLPLLISAIWYFTFSNNFNSFDRDFSYIQSCDTLKIEIDRVKFISDSIETEIEKDDTGASVFGTMSTLTSLAIQMAKLQEQAEYLGCEFMNMDQMIIDIEVESNKFEDNRDEDINN
ncbi:MAG: hypothetical protein ACI86M_000748 [Saprospiraceae bacterium]|jgi:hypothetical protein